MLGKPGHLAWMKVVGSSGIPTSQVTCVTWLCHMAAPTMVHLRSLEAVNINGDLNSKMVKGIAGSELPAAAKDWQ